MDGGVKDKKKVKQEGREEEKFDPTTIFDNDGKNKKRKRRFGKTELPLLIDNIKDG